MNFKTSLLLLAILFNLNTIYCAENKYPVADIPAELKENAKAVVRFEKIEFDILSPGKTKQKVQYAITILNKNGLFNGVFIQFYDKFSRISNINGKVFNEKGELYKRFQFDDIQDYSFIDGFTLFADNRVKFIDPEYEIYPFTVEYTFEIDINGSFYFPPWMPCKDYNVAIEKSEFMVSVPISYKFRYLEKNLNDSCKITNDNINIYYQWSLTNCKAIVKEDFSMSISDYMPVVFPAPSDFEMEGVKGNFETWQNFGKWIGELNEGRDELDEESTEYLSNLVKDARNDTEKVRILYEYLQNKTRYVSIQIGIGGWQPFDSKVVDKNSYGDCKALSNYMKAILKAVGINSNYTIIRAGAETPEFISDFPFNQFNHAILCVPLEKDTIWLECTSQRIPFGYLGSFTDDRQALIITDSGGVMVNTPVYTPDVNHKISKAKVSIEENGVWSSAEISVSHGGLFYDGMMRFITGDEKDKKKFIEEKMGLPAFILSNYTFHEKRTFPPDLSIDLNVRLNKHATILNDRLIIPLNLLNKIKEIPGKTQDRKSEILIRRAYQVTDSINYIIPNGYYIDQIPENQTINSVFGSYNYQIIKSDESLLYIRSFKMNKGRYPVSEYENFSTFHKQIEKCDNAKFILKKIQVSP